MKPLGHKSYGSIPHLSNSRLGIGDHHIEKGQEEIATKKARDWKDLIIVQEKLDGSNVSVAKISGEIIALGRAGYLAQSSPYKQHQLFAYWVRQNEERFRLLLAEGERVVGEWLALAHGTKYNLKHEPFVAFDLMVGYERACYLNFVFRTIPLEFTIPKLIHIGQPISVKRVLEKLEPSGHGAIDPVEGAIWRVERENKVDFLCKYVRQDKIDGCYLEDDIWNWLP